MQSLLRTTLRLSFPLNTLQQMILPFNSECEHLHYSVFSFLKSLRNLGIMNQHKDPLSRSCIQFTLTSAQELLLLCAQRSFSVVLGGKNLNFCAFSQTPDLSLCASSVPELWILGKGLLLTTWKEIKTVLFLALISGICFNHDIHGYS